MANVNSSRGYVFLPAQVVTNATEVVLTVPAATALYQGLPSPLFSAGGPLYLNVAPDSQSANPAATSPTYVNDSVDGRQFKVRVVGVATVSASSTLALSLYYGSSQTVANNTKVATVTSAALNPAGSYNFVMEANFLWDSTSSVLNGYFKSDVNNTFTGDAAITHVTSVSATSLYFIPSFTYATGNAANQVQIKEFLFEQV